MLLKYTSRKAVSVLLLSSAIRTKTAFFWMQIGNDLMKNKIGLTQNFCKDAELFYNVSSNIQIVFSLIIHDWLCLKLNTSQPRCFILKDFKKTCTFIIEMYSLWKPATLKLLIFYSFSKLSVQLSLSI